MKYLRTIYTQNKYVLLRFKKSNLHIIAFLKYKMSGASDGFDQRCRVYM